MARRCSITGKGVQTGNNVSHSNRKSRRRFVPNIQRVTFYSEALNTNVRLRVSVHTIRSVDHNGGLDKFLLKTSSLKLTPDAVTLKRRITKAIATKAVPVAAAPAAQAA